MHKGAGPAAARCRLPQFGHAPDGQALVRGRLRPCAPRGEAHRVAGPHPARRVVAVPTHSADACEPALQRALSQWRRGNGRSFPQPR